MNHPLRFEDQCCHRSWALVIVASDCGVVWAWAWRAGRPMRRLWLCQASVCLLFRLLDRSLSRMGSRLPPSVFLCQRTMRTNTRTRAIVRPHRPVTPAQCVTPRTRGGLVSVKLRHVPTPLDGIYTALPSRLLTPVYSPPFSIPSLAFSSFPH
jgi:hypothetical protein